MGVFRKGHLVRVESLFTKLAPSEQKVAMAVLKDPSAAMEMGISELASLSGASKAAVVRFCKKSGFSGYKQFKAAMIQEIGSLTAPGTGHTPQSMSGHAGNTGGLSEVILENHIEFLRIAFGNIDKSQLEMAAKGIARSRKVAIFATGLSAVIAQELNNRLMRLGFDTQFEASSYAQNMQASKLSHEDMAIGISFSGTTKEVIDSATLAKHMGASTLAITNYPNMPLAQLSDFVLSTGLGQDQRDIGMWSVPRVVGLAVVDLLMGAVGLYMKGGVEDEAEASRQAILYRLNN